MEGYPMIAAPHIISWFRSDPLPPVLADDFMIFGGTHLISLFLDSVVAMTGRRELGITVPFVEQGFAHACPEWKQVAHQDIDFFLVVRRRSDVDCAIAHLSMFPWRSLRIAREPSLHAKVFTCIGADGAAAALVGSHNLTRAGARTNYEAGLLMKTLRRSPTTSIIEELHDQGRHLLVTSDLQFDSSCWPSPMITERTKK